MARSNVLSKPVTGWEVGYEDRADSPTFYSHRAGTAHVIAAINFDLLRLCSETSVKSGDRQVRHALDSTAGLVALRAAARLRLTHVVRALGIARLVSVDIIDCSGGYSARPGSDPQLHQLPTEFPIGVYVQRSGTGHWGDLTKARENGYQHPSHECPLHGGHDWIIGSAWTSNGLQLQAIDTPYEREAIRFSLVSLIEQVYGTQIHAWRPNLPRPNFPIYEDGFNEFDEEDYQKQVAEDIERDKNNYRYACEHQVGYVLCSDLLGFVLPSQDRTNASKRVWSPIHEVFTQFQIIAKAHGCDVGDVRDIALWLDSNRADHDPPRAAEHGPYDLCVDVAEAFGLEYDSVDLANLRRMADGPDIF